MSVAFVFPGQGSQVVGMGKSLADNFGVARRVFEEVDAALDTKISTVIFEGPADTLTLTENAQPALMAVSLAAFRTLGLSPVGLLKFLSSPLYSGERRERTSWRTRPL